jgi:hypothetical protein
MQTLGLDGAPSPQPWYKLWIWPDVETPEDAVGAARNGAIAAVAIGAFTMVFGGLANGPVVIFDGLFYLLVAIGIRQLSFPASGMAVATYGMSQLVAMRQGHTPGVIGLALSLLLVGAARASWHALRINAADRARVANDSPEESWTQRAMRQMSSPFWSKIRVGFNVVLFLYFALLMTGLAVMLARVA